MLQDIRNSLERCGAGLWRDAVGFAAMTVVFVGALHMPSLL